MGSEILEGLIALIKEVVAGEDFLRDHPDVFLGAIEIASANLARYRPDLDQVDELLWETTLKHRVLEELLEERSTGLTQRLNRREIEELLEVGRTTEVLPLLNRLGEEVESTEQLSRTAAETPVAVGSADTTQEIRTPGRIDGSYSAQNG